MAIAYCLLLLCAASVQQSYAGWFQKKDDAQKFISELVDDPSDASSKFGGPNRFKFNWIQSETDERIETGNIRSWKDFKQWSEQVGAEAGKTHSKIVGRFKGHYIRKQCNGYFDGQVEVHLSQVIPDFSHPEKMSEELKTQTKTDAIDDSSKENLLKHMDFSSKSWVLRKPTNKAMEFKWAWVQGKISKDYKAHKDCSVLETDLKELITNYLLPHNVDVTRDGFLKSELDAIVKSSVLQCGATAFKNDFDTMKRMRDYLCGWAGHLEDDEVEQRSELVKEFVTCAATRVVKFVGMDCSRILSDYELPKKLEKITCQSSWGEKGIHAVDKIKSISAAKMWNGTKNFANKFKDGTIEFFQEMWGSEIKADRGVSPVKAAVLLLFRRVVSAVQIFSVAIEAMLIVANPLILLSFCDDEPIQAAINIPMFFFFDVAKSKFVRYQCRDTRPRDLKDMMTESKEALMNNHEDWNGEDFITLSSFGTPEHPFKIDWFQDVNKLIVHDNNEKPQKKQKWEWFSDMMGNSKNENRLTTQLSGEFSGFYDGKYCHGPFWGSIHIDLVKDKKTYDFIREIHHQKRQGDVSDLIESTNYKKWTEKTWIALADNAVELKKSGAVAAPAGMSKFKAAIKKNEARFNNMVALRSLPWVFEEASHGFENKITIKQAGNMTNIKPNQCTQLRHNLQYAVIAALKQEQEPFIVNKSLSGGNLISLEATGYTNAQIAEIVDSAVERCEMLKSYNVGDHVQSYDINELRPFICGKKNLPSLEEDLMMQRGNQTYAFIHCVTRESLKQLGTACANVMEEYNIGLRVDMKVCGNNKFHAKFRGIKQSMVNGIKSVTGHFFSFKKDKEMTPLQRIGMGLFAGLISITTAISTSSIVIALAVEFVLFAPFMSILAGNFLLSQILGFFTKKYLAQPCKLPAMELEKESVEDTVKGVIEELKNPSA